MNRFEEVEEHGLKTQDKKHLLTYLGGGKLTPMQTIHAKCYTCMGYYIDGKEDCGIDNCPNYPYMRFNPHRVKGKSRMNDEQRVLAGERLKKVRNIAGSQV